MMLELIQFSDLSVEKNQFGYETSSVFSSKLKDMKPVLKLSGDSISDLQKEFLLQNPSSDSEQWGYITSSPFYQQSCSSSLNIKELYLYRDPLISKDLERFLDTHLDISEEFVIISDEIRSIIEEKKIHYTLETELFRDPESPDWIKVNFIVKTEIKDFEEQDRLWDMIFDRVEKRLKAELDKTALSHIFNIFIE